MQMDYSPFWVSIKTAITATMFTFVLGIIIAWWVAGCNDKLKGFIDSILTLPMVLPPTVVGFFLLLIFGRNSYIGAILNRIGIQIIFTWTATVIAATVVSFPLMYKTARGAFEQIDQNLIYAAKTLGASRWKIFWKIAVPLAWPGIAAGGILSFARALGEFGATLMVAGSIVGKTQTIPIAIYFAAEGGDMDKALTWVILICIISFITIHLMNIWNAYDKTKIPKVRRK